MRRSRLRTHELVEAAILADVAVLLIVVGFFVPATGALLAASVVPFALLVVRHRPRALLVGAISAGVVATLALGPNFAFQVGGSAAAGYVVGIGVKRGWGRLQTIAFGLATAWAFGAAIVVGLLWVFPRSRALTLEQARLQWTGAKHFLTELLRAADALAAQLRTHTAGIALEVELGGALGGALLVRAKRRPARIALAVLLGLYVASLAVVDVWLGALALAAAAAAGQIAARSPALSLRRAVTGAWLACALLTALGLAAGGRAPLLASLDAQWHPLRRALEAGESAAFAFGDAVVGWLVAHWWVAAPAGLILPVVGVILLARAMTRPIVARVERAVGRPAPAPPSGALATTGPLPVRLRDVSFTYPGHTRPALHGVSLQLTGGYVGILGENGSGKSTLARILAGTPPSTGTVERPGDAGLGREGGTAIIFQRPESQVLGVRVRDDVFWGLATGIDPAPLLERVGLRAFADRETSTLSGGELQRLAVAAALARRPRLLVSDEATAMVDPEGRKEIVRLFLELVAEGLCVVHITHRPDELRHADVVYVLDHGRIRSSGPPAQILGVGT